MNLNRESNDFDKFDFDNIFISDELESDSISISDDDEFIFELSDDTDVSYMNELSGNVISGNLLPENVVSENDKLLISQLEFLIDNQHLPNYLYPVDNLITNEYITKISSYLYKIFIHRKIVGFQNERNNHRTYKSSPLKRSYKPNDILPNNELKTSFDDLIKLIKEDLEFMDNICNNFTITGDEIV
jgi:hypothetical protein